MYYTYDDDFLGEITRVLKTQREQRRNELRHLLRTMYGSAVEVAGKVRGEQQARWLLEAHRRIPHKILASVDPLAPIDDGDSIYFQNRWPYAGALRDALAELCLIGCDLEFPCPRSSDEVALADELIDAIAHLTPAQSVALHLIMEAAHTVFVGTIYYPNWWTPPIMVRLLESPELDRLDHHH